MSQENTSIESKALMYNCGLTHFLCHFFELSYPALSLFIASDLKLPLVEVIAAGLPLYLFLGLFAVPWGVISDKKGSFFSLGIACLISALGSCLLAGSHKLSSISFSLGIIGIGIAAFHPAGMSAISTNYSHKRGRALAVHGIWGGIGIISAPICSGIFAYWFHWRSFFLLAALIAAATGIWSLSIHRTQSPISLALKQEKTIKGFFSSILKIFRYREFFLLVLTMTIAGLVYRAVTISLPVLLKTSSDQPLLQIANLLEKTLPTLANSNPLDAGSSLLMGLAVLGGILGQKFAGGLADRYNLARCYFYFFLCAIPCLFLLGLLSGTPLIIFSMIYFFFSLGMQPIENSLVAELSPKEILSSIYGIKFLFSFGIVALVVFPVGKLVEQNNFTLLYSSLAALFVVHIIIVANMKLFWRSQGSESIGRSN